MAIALSFHRSGKKAFLSAAFLAGLSLITLSMLSFIADRYAFIAERILDNPRTDDRDVLDIDEQNIPEYSNAINALDMARILAPLNSDYTRTLTDLYSRIRVWQETALAVGISQLEGLPTGNELRNSVHRTARKSVMLDPANADHLLALGQIYAVDDLRESALEQMIKAVNSYPINGAIRYSAAMQMMLIGLPEQAREQARMLAKTDDSYYLDDDDPTADLIRERRPPHYEARLARSYLYKAMEITWRTSARDPKAILAIVPNNIDAWEVARLFFEEKGIDNVVNDRNEEVKK